VPRITVVTTAARYVIRYAYVVSTVFHDKQRTSKTPIDRYGSAALDCYLERWVMIASECVQFLSIPLRAPGV
jgi:hypothetical protein